LGEVGDAFVGMSAKDFVAISEANPEEMKKRMYTRLF
jgi:hypothetical protein